MGQDNEYGLHTGGDGNQNGTFGGQANFGDTFNTGDPAIPQQTLKPLGEYMNFKLGQQQDLPTNSLGKTDYRAISIHGGGYYSPDTHSGSQDTKQRVRSTIEQEPELDSWEPVLNPRGFYNRARELRSWGHEVYPREENSDKRHETVSYQLTKEYGPGWTRFAGITNELQGLFFHDLPDLPGRLRGERPWAFSMKDMNANEVGIQRAVEEMKERRLMGMKPWGK